MASITVTMRPANALSHKTMNRNTGSFPGPFSQSLILCFVLLIFSPPLSAQQPWTLQDCIDHALQHNLDIRHQRLQSERTGHDVYQSYAMVLPSFDASSGAGLRFGRSVDEVTNEIFTERLASHRIHADGSMRLFAGFQTINNIRYNLSRQTAVRYDTRSMENDLILTIANAFLQILYFEDMVEVAREQLELSRQQVDKTRILFEGGTVSRGNLLEMEAVAAEDEVRYTAAQNHLNLSYIELTYLLELDPEEPFSIARPNTLDVEESQVLQDPAVIADRAMRIEPTVAAARERITMAERYVDITRGRRWPGLSLNGGYQTAYSEAFTRVVNEGGGNGEAAMMAFGMPVRHPDPGHRDNQPEIIREVIPYREQIRDNYSFTVQFVLRVPIFNNWQVRNSIQQSRIDLEQARLGYERSRNNLGQVIHQAHADALAAYKEYMSYNKSLEAARESYAFSEQGFALGLVSSLELNEAKARLNRAEVSALQSVYEFVFKTKILEFYQGEGFVL